MKKNNKGFTLVEIIAVVTILGILLIVSIPKILSLVTDSRDEMYVQDAKKLIAQAQYVLSSNSDEVEKPVVGDYIVLSLNYLGTDAFSSPPNGGEYLTESSFVVVKNVQTDENAEFENYKYSVVLVEAAADGFYRGIKFRTEEELSDEGAKTLVDYFDSSELVYVDEDAANRAGCDDFDKCVVNNVYVDTYSNDKDMKPANVGEDNFVGRYNVLITQVETEDKVYATAPEFNAKVLSSHPSMQMLTGHVDVTANFQEDQEVLKVCINVSKKSSNDFPSIDDSSACIPYFNGTDFSYQFNLLDYGFTYEDRDYAYFYIVVVDDDRNYSRKRIPYEVHKNTAPEITKFVVKRHRDNDGINFNMNYATLSAEVSDDMDEFNDLSVCISDKSSKGGETCNNYVPFSSIFGSSNKYFFKDSSGNQLNTLDGSKHYLTLFVKDSGGLVSQAYAKYDVDGVDEAGPYIVYKNKPPVLNVKLNPNRISIDGYKSGNSLEGVGVLIEVSDDMTKTENIKIKIGDYREVSMSEYKVDSSPLQKYTFSGDYDGEKRYLDVIATDQFGLSTKVTAVLDDVYKNEKPKVKFNVTSSGSFISKRKVLKNPTPEGCSSGSEDICFELKTFACTDEKKCKGSLKDNNVVNGSYTAQISASITDDLTGIGDMLACLSEKEDACTANSEFVPASTFSSYSYVFDKDVDAPYVSNLTDRTLYLTVKDSYGATTKSSVKYSFYKNTAPKFVSVGADNITSTRSINISSVKIKNNFVIEDDFNDYDVDFCYLVKEKDYSGGNPKVSEFKNCTRVLQNNSMDFVFVDDEGKPLGYNGQKVYTIYKATDGYEATDTIYGDVYTLSSNVAPKILDFTVESKDERYNSVRFDIKFKVSDPEDTYTFCITTLAEGSKGYCDASTYDGQSHYSKESYSGDDESEHVYYVYNADKFNWNRTSKEYEQWKYSFDVDGSFTEDDGKGSTTQLDTLLFVVKDSSGDTDKFEYRYVPRNSCSIHDEEYQKILKKEEQEKHGVAEGDTEITDNDIYMEIIDESDYEAMTKEEADDAGAIPKGEDLSSVADAISPDSCNGMCYTDIYEEDIDYSTSAFLRKNSVEAYFKRNISYIDRLVQGEIAQFGFLPNDDCNADIFARLGCNFASCFDTKNVNYNVVSLHLYARNTIWTSKVSGLKSSRIKYNSYCKIPEKQKELLFSELDYRVLEGANSYCNSDKMETWCKNRIKKDFDEEMDTELRNCDNIKKADPTPECIEINDAAYCVNHLNEYIDEDLYNKYHSGAEDAPSEEVYNEMINTAKEACNNTVITIKNNCAIQDEANELEYRNNLDACRESIAEINAAITENNEKKAAYYKNLNDCSAEYKNACETNIASYSIIPANEGKLEVSCNSTDGDIIRVNCDPNSMDGKCLKENCDPSPDECEDGKECKVDPNKITCIQFCYKDIKCDEKSNVQVEAVCHGYFKLYRSTVDGRKVKIEDTGMRLCPELFSSKAYSNQFSYKDKKYVKFFPRDYGGIINE